VTVITNVTRPKFIPALVLCRKAWHKTITSINSPVTGVMLALLLGINFLKNFVFSVAGNPALSISFNSYAGAFVPGAVVGHGSKNRCGAFFVVRHQGKFCGFSAWLFYRSQFSGIGFATAPQLRTIKSRSVAT
jgi:hypothetical protein